MTKRLKCLSCQSLTHMVRRCAAQSTHQIEVTFLEIGLHNDPATLGELLQAQIDATRAADYDAIVLAYGLCGQATAGLKAGAVPLVMPRAHDCITLFLGSRTRYQDQIEQHPGTYWYVQDFAADQAEAGGKVAIGSAVEESAEALYESYVAKYGQDNADYLMSVMGGWHKHYKRGVYIALEPSKEHLSEAQTAAEVARYGWAFERMLGDTGLICRLLHAEWDDDFLVVQPGEMIAMAYGDEVVCRKPGV